MRHPTTRTSAAPPPTKIPSHTHAGGTGTRRASQAARPELARPSDSSPASGTDAVGSKPCHPTPGNQTSAQACASLALTSYSPVNGLRSPGAYPVTSRAGTPSERSITTRLVPICSQKPRRSTNRNRSTASAPSGSGATSRV